MWLPYEERHLLAGYVANIGEVGGRKVFDFGELGRLLKRGGSGTKIQEHGNRDKSTLGDSDRKTVAYIRRMNRVEPANNRLMERGLIKVENHVEKGVFVVELTLAGYDLGNKYTTFWGWSGLWFQEYRNHWIWLLFSFLGGILGAVLVQFIVSLLGNGQTPCSGG